jgi:hypothetical protein
MKFENACYGYVQTSLKVFLETEFSKCLFPHKGLWLIFKFFNTKK